MYKSFILFLVMGFFELSMAVAGFQIILLSVLTFFAPDNTNAL